MCWVFPHVEGPKLRAQNLRHLRPLYKRVKRRIFSSYSSSNFLQPLEVEEKEREWENHHFWREKHSFFLTAQIPSNVRSYFIYGPIDLKFGGEVCDSLIFNLNGGDQIWRSGRSSFSLRIEPLFWCIFYPDSFDLKLRSRLIRGSIEPIFGEHV